MRLLLTWAPPAFTPHVDPGPILRLLEHADPGYDAAVLLCPRTELPVARAQAAAMRRYIEAVEVRPVELPDPSDHAQLFAILQALLPELPAAEADVLLSAGTPQAQTLWVILVQAGLLKARMLQVIPARFVPVPHPHPVREVRFEIEGFPEIRALREEVVRLRAQVADREGALVGRSPPMRRLAERIERVAAARVPVLVLGETGTGKELVARALHQASDRAAQPFVAENCGAFAEGVLASELFGHEAGAFTGATGRHRGVFERADGGTLFLDEVGELPPAVQVRLLRVLQEGVLRRVGGEVSITVDVRVIAATHRDLRALVAAGAFREDLYYRLCGATLEVPPLRDRPGDLEALIVHFLRAEGRSDLRLARSVWRALQAWSWPGNVRELQAEVRRWTVFCDEEVHLDDLAPEIRAGAPMPGPAPRVAAPHERTLAEVVADAEATAVRAALAATGGNRSAAARRLDIDRHTLARKVAALGLEGS